MKCNHFNCKNCKHCMELDEYLAPGLDTYAVDSFIPPDGNRYCHLRHFICFHHMVERLKAMIR